MTAYEKSSLFDGRNEKAWICRIATNKCLDYQKHSGRRSIPTEDTYFILQETGQSSPEERCLEEEVKEGLRKACESLKPPYDEIALEHYYYEMNVNEIAARHEKNPKTVQTQIYRARGMLRKLYESGSPGGGRDSGQTEKKKGLLRERGKRI